MAGWACRWPWGWGPRDGLACPVEAERERTMKTKAWVRLFGVAMALSLVLASGGGSAAAAALPRAAPGPTSANGCRAGSVQITWWDWVLGFDRAATEFNKTHPGICVTIANVGAGQTEYTKLTAAFKAGSGAPDVAEIEYYELPTFEIQKNLLNLAPYGAGKLKSDHTAWSWKQVTEGSSIYGLPFDAAPLDLFYNATAYKSYGLTPATTWQEFASQATQLHAQHPSTYLMDFYPEDASLIIALMLQAGVQPFTWHGGKNIAINFTSPAAQRFDQYWQNLIDSKAVTTSDDSGNQFFANLDNNVVASFPMAPWGPKGFAPAASKTVGQWRLASLPQWKSGADVQVNLGGSAYCVTRQSKHPKQAAEFVKWLTSNEASWSILSTPPSSEFPSYTPFLNSPTLANETFPLTGPQQIENVFKATAKKELYTSFPPFMIYVTAEFTDLFAPVVSGKETMQQAMQKLQTALVAYAKQQGFTVTK